MAIPRRKVFSGSEGTHEYLFRASLRHAKNVFQFEEVIQLDLLVGRKSLIAFAGE